MQKRDAKLPGNRKNSRDRGPSQAGRTGALERSGKRNEEKKKTGKALDCMDDGFGVCRRGRGVQLLPGAGGAGKTGGAGR